MEQREMLQDQDLAVSFTVDRTPDEVFSAINRVQDWWTGDPGVEGNTAAVGDEFDYGYGDIHRSRQKVTGLVPGKKVVWLVLEADLSFTRDRAEWKGTEITFDIVPKGRQTEVRFTHHGLTPRFECYESCSEGWSYYITVSLQNFIEKGVVHG